MKFYINISILNKGINMEDYSGFVYLWINKINGKKYLGSHKGKIDDNYIGSGIVFRNAIKKYGIDNFERNIIEIIKNPEEIQLREQYWLDYYNVAKNQEFYNISGSASGGRTMEGKTENELIKWRKKCRVSQLNKTYTPTEEAIIKMSLSSKQFWENSQEKLKQSTRMIGNHLRKGVLHSEKSKEKMKISQSSRPRSLEERQKMGTPQNNFRGIQITINNETFKSKKEAANKLKISMSSLNKMLNGKELPGRGINKRIPITLNGVSYQSHKEACSKLKIGNQTLNKILKNDILIGKGKNKKSQSHFCKKVKINNIEYNSMQDAVKNTGYSWYKIRKIYKENHDLSK